MTRGYLAIGIHDTRHLLGWGRERNKLEVEELQKKLKGFLQLSDRSFAETDTGVKDTPPTGWKSLVCDARKATWPETFLKQNRTHYSHCGCWVIPGIFEKGELGLYVFTFGTLH